MKVKELVEKLKQMPEDNDILLFIEDGDFDSLEGPLELVELGEPNNNLVILSYEQKL